MKVSDDHNYKQLFAASPLAYMGDAVSYHSSQQPTSLDLTFPAGDFICVFLMGLYTANHNTL